MVAGAAWLQVAGVGAGVQLVGACLLGVAAVAVGAGKGPVLGALGVAGGAQVSKLLCREAWEGAVAAGVLELALMMSSWVAGVAGLVEGVVQLAQL